MSLSSALGAALSGLSVTARRAEVVSSNIANAGVAGYARRDLAVQSSQTAPGARVVALLRQADPLLQGERRAADADAAGKGLLAAQLAKLGQSFGATGQEGSLQSTLDRFSAALISARARPDSLPQLASLAQSAQDVQRRFVSISDSIQSLRAEADARIAADVGRLNADLAEIATLDRQIASARTAGRDSASLMDQRQVLVDRAASIVPLREVPQGNGRTLLVSLDGAVLLDGRPAVIGFARSPIISASSGAALPGLTLDGQPVSATVGGLLSGGALGAAFDLRDTVLPGLQAGLDGLAFSLGKRFQDADPTLGPGQSGLFSDQGGAIDPAQVQGLSARLRLSADIDPDQPATLRLLRDGIGSTAPGPTGDASLLSALSDAFRATTPIGIPQQAADLVDSLSLRRLSAEAEAGMAAARQSTLQESEAAQGVNTDRELQDLLQIEKAYAANARVIQTVDRMLQTLLEI